ncbi:MAG TPA: hotdog fold thioesterase [Chitinophagales bacterium]|nr:hotdog fold thioesterase [Chitinophagales bacterium]
MSIWKSPSEKEFLNDQSKHCMPGHIGIEVTEVGDDFVKARMPVDHRTTQPYGLLHGGASVALAESLGSVAGTMCVNVPDEAVVGIEINANHIRPVRSGFVEGVARPLHIGKTTQVWEIRISNEAGKLVCISRITLAVVKAR